MHAPIELSIAQQFEIERFSRAIDANADADQLRSLAKQLLQAWHTQKAATNWAIQQQMSPPPASPWNAPTC
ncbi:MAG: hypothetical protein QM522_07605 [Chitinophagaceae bacterium]|jgi:hypothetical protein|nr:hypothetical protein [Chitinophagaceae bacterium]